MQLSIDSLTMSDNYLTQPYAEKVSQHRLGDNMHEYRRRLNYHRAHLKNRQTGLLTSSTNSYSLPPVGSTDSKKYIREKHSHQVLHSEPESRPRTLDESKYMLETRAEEIKEAMRLYEEECEREKKLKALNDSNNNNNSKRNSGISNLPSISSSPEGTGLNSRVQTPGRINKDPKPLDRVQVQLLMHLDYKSIIAMRREFKKRNWKLSIYEFVLVSCSYMQPSTDSAAHVDALCEMFRDIDVGGDGKMDWKEFTGHLVQVASNGLSSDDVPSYEFSLDEDQQRHDYHCEYVKWHADLGRFVVFERTTHRFKLYHANGLLCLGSIAGPVPLYFFLIHTHCLSLSLSLSLLTPVRC